jgi:diguanylate cyclase
MIELGASLELDVVAEGVETRRVWDWLSELCCMSAQGFLLCRPLAPEQLREWLASRPRSSA